MAPSRLLKDLLGCCFGVSSHNGHGDDDDPRGDRDNSSSRGGDCINPDKNTTPDETTSSKDAFKHETTPESTVIPGVTVVDQDWFQFLCSEAVRSNQGSDGNKNDVEEEEFDNGNTKLCQACRRIDFLTLFTSHQCLVEEESDGCFYIPWQVHEKLACRCEVALDLPGYYKGIGRPVTNRVDYAEPACLFCDFLYQCQTRLDLIPTGSDPWRCMLRPFHSLQGPPLHTSSNARGDRSCCVEDVALPRFCKMWKGDGYKLRYRHEWSNSQGILRVINSGSGTSLTRHKEAGGGLLGRRLDSNRVNFSLVNEWLTLCRSAHNHCKGLDMGHVQGLLVIDCSTSCIVSLPPQDNAASEEAPYVTLSYLWGTVEASNGPVVQSSNDGSIIGLRLPPQVPLVISDAIQVVSQLGYRYLWVDRYCIPQTDAEAKHTQIRNMGKIYANSALTIIAAAGEGPEYGLPGVSTRARTEQLSVQVTDHIALVLYESPVGLIKSSKWNTRGWTYQEGLLSKRRLVFTDSMIYFQCQQLHDDEVLSLPIPGLGEDCDDVRALAPDDLPEGRFFPQLAKGDNAKMAWDRILEFEERQLTYDSDTLDAVSGILESYALGDEQPTAAASFYGLPILPPSSHSMNSFTYRACSFHAWFEYGDPQEGAQTASKLVDNNLTYWLANNLSWGHQWCHLRESAPKSFNEARRPMFSTWTWAGWKAKKSAPDYISMFDSGLRISIQYDNGLMLDWEKDNVEIMDISRSGTIPLSLNIRGMVMEVKIHWTTRWSDGTGPEGWSLKLPIVYEPDIFFAPQWLFGLEGSDLREEKNLLLLILGSNYLEFKESDVNLGFVGLLIRPVKKMVNGRPQTFHERLLGSTFRFGKEIWPYMTSLPREMEVQLI